MSTTQTILGLAEELRIIADEISYNAVDSSSDFPARGTIVKATASQARFKATAHTSTLLVARVSSLHMRDYQATQKWCSKRNNFATCPEHDIKLLT